MMRKTPLKKIGRKRRARGPSERNTFLLIWRDRPHYCGVCGKNIRDPKARCFAHILAKGMYPKRRTDPNNIILVCSTSCHHAVDKARAKHERLIEARLEEGKQTTYTFLSRLS